MLFKGVRSSCDMFARNSDLYLEVSASSLAFSSNARRACSISWFFRSTSAFCSASCRAFWANCSFVCCNSFCWVWSSVASCWDCFSSPSVCIVASILLRTMPMLAVSCSRNARCEAVKAPKEANSITALTRSSKSTGSTITFLGTASNKPDRIEMLLGGKSFISIRLFSAAHCPIRPSPIFSCRRCPSSPSPANAERSTMVAEFSLSIW